MVHRRRTAWYRDGAREMRSRVGGTLAGGLPNSNKGERNGAGQTGQWYGLRWSIREYGAAIFFRLLPASQVVLTACDRKFQTGCAIRFEATPIDGRTSSLFPFARSNRRPLASTHRLLNLQPAQ